VQFTQYLKASGAADSVKPGVERSGGPRDRVRKIKARGAADSRIIKMDVL